MHAFMQLTSLAELRLAPPSTNTFTISSLDILIAFIRAETPFCITKKYSAYSMSGKTFFVYRITPYLRYSSLLLETPTISLCLSDHFEQNESVVFLQSIKGIHTCT